MSTEENKVETTADQNDEWIVQSKPQRRLMPQHALSKQDLETDKAKAAAAPAPAPEAKKKVIRYSKEEMMTYRQPVKMLSSMAELTEILSPERQNPVCFERFEPEDVIRIWNSEKGGPKNLEGGRGRGRGKTFKNDEGGEGQQGEWSNPREGGGSGKGGLWDDSTAAGGSGGDGLDLSDFAAMALKFRSEMETMKLNGEGGEPSALGEDAMTLLADEQSRRNAGVLEDDDDALPDWATDEPAPQPETKRSLLLDTLNIKRQPEPAPVVVTQSVTVASATYGIGSGLDLNISSATVVSSPPPLVARVEPPTEWHYTDPAGQMQGPFPQDTMRAWHEAGYFNADLPIKLRHWQRFHPFQTVFPDFKVAFLSVPQEPGSGSLVLSLQQQQQAALLRQQQEEQRREQERLAAEAQRREAEQRAQQEALRQAEIARQQEQARQAQLAEQQRQAQQLLLQQQAQQQAELEAQRALLEQQLQQQQQQQKAAAAAAPAPQHKEQQQQQPAASPAKPATVAPWANKQPGAQRGQDLTAIQQEEAAAREAERKRAAAEQAKITKGWSAPSNSGATLSLAEIQAQEEEQRRRQQVEAARSAPAPAPATSSMSSQLKSLLGVRAPAAPANASSGPAWGTAAGAAPTKPAASLKDIMQEEHSGRGEETSAPAAVAAPATGGRKPTSWAAKAGSTTFSAPEPAAPRVASRTPPSSATAQPAATSPAPARAAAPAAASAPAPAAKPSAAKNEKSSFGGKEMSPDMANWCAAQLKRLNGSDDLTLVQFCMSLDSAAEIRQYLSEYLGSSPAVTNFATDFIKYKEGGKKALEGSGVALGGAGVPISSANNNNPSNFVSAGKKKSGNRNK